MTKPTKPTKRYWTKLYYLIAERVLPTSLTGDTEVVLASDYDRDTAALREQVARYQARLEITHCFDAEGKSKEIPEAERDKFPDGITCRDATIKLVDERNEELAVECKALREQLAAAQGIAKHEYKMRQLEQQAKEQAQARCVELEKQCKELYKRTPAGLSEEKA